MSKRPNDPIPMGDSSGKKMSKGRAKKKKKKKTLSPKTVILREPVKRWLGNIAVMAGIVIVMLLLTELSLRLFFPISYYRYQPYSHKLDDELGYTLTPEITTQISQAEFVVNISTNSFGFRDRPYTLSELEQKDVVILALGDSMTEAYGVEEHESFTSLIEQGLEREGLSSEVINTGVGGYGIIQERKTAERYVPIFKPDVVLLNLYLENDIRDDHNFLKNPKWYLVEGQKSKREVRGVKKVVLSTFIAKYIHRIISGNPLVIRLYYTFIGKPLPIDYLQFQKEYDSRMNEEWDRTVAEITQLHEYLTNQGISLIITAIPSRLQISPQIQRGMTWAYRLNEEEFDFWRSTTLLGDFAREREIAFVDLRYAFSTKGEALYYPIDGHLTTEGHQISAGAILPIVKEVIEGG